MSTPLAHPVLAPFDAVVVALPLQADAHVRAGAPVVVLEAMKMEHEVLADVDGVVRELAVAVGEAVREGQLLATLEPRAAVGAAARRGRRGDRAGRASATTCGRCASATRSASTPPGARPSPAATSTGAAPHARTSPSWSTPARSSSTARCCSPRRSAAARREELIERTPADGLVGGVGDVDGHSCVVMSYDYTVLAGTQGMRNHAKKDRLFELAERRRLPVVLFAEGGGGRPGDVDMPIVAGLDCRAFALFASLSGLVPLVGVAAGYCFAGNAALLGCCDVVIATEDSSIGMGGPAMIEGGGLGVHHPAEVGPIDVQYGNGVVDLGRATNARRSRWRSATCPTSSARAAPGALSEPERLRELVPQERKRRYEIRAVVEELFDEGSVLELRRGWGPGMVTALARLQGRPLGVIANDAAHLGGAIDAEAADKAARFLQLCDGFELPVLLLCDTPGFMVGPAAERTATVRHFARMFLAGANVSVPIGTIVLRKGYGLGAQAMAGGGFKAPLFTVGWPTSEFGAMGLEGAVRLGMRRELEAIEDPDERERVFGEMVATAYERGRGLNMAAYGEIDDVIDPADSRRWIDTLFDERAAAWWERPGKKRPNIDAW